MKFEIKHRWSGSVLFETEAETQREAILKAVKSGSNLRGSDLRGSDLSDSNLSGSNLSDSDLSGSNLRDSDLSGSYLRGSNLRGSNLRGSDLSGSNLRDSDLRDSNLSDSDLSGSNLRGSNLRDSDLSGSNLTPIRDDFFAVLSCAPREVAALRMALTNGKVNGSTYHGECACLVGTIANAQHVNLRSIPGLQPNSARPAERFFLAIREGDTPETNQFSALAVQWLDQWVANMESAFGTKASA
ncbi:MAG TPA: pentapeptide repeat-containing protein [Burkholderiales bacterium]|nr:pentapeptide repeat-containing protein [Burkholderiales bacterium]